LVGTFAALTLTLSACVTVKPGSLQVSQPGGIGNVNFDLQLCNAKEEGGTAPKECGPDDHSGEAQVLLAFLVSKGATNLPGGFTATPGPAAGGSPIGFHRSPSFDSYISAQPGFPADLESLSYISDPTNEHENDNFEWSVKFPVGVPAAADGGSSVGPLKYILL